MSFLKNRPKLNRVVKGGKFLRPKKWEDFVPGDFIEGTLVRAEETDLYGKPIYEIQGTLDEEGNHVSKFTGVNPTILDGEKEGIIPVYSNGSIAFQLAQLEIGDYVKLTYRGMATTSKGKFKGRPCHNVEVESDRVFGDEEETSDNDLLG